jgi:beta-galactosidase
MGFHKPIDYWALAAREDVVAQDSYPDTSNPEWMIDSGMTCDLIRSLGEGRPWMLMEQAPTHVNWRARNATKRPGVMRLGSYQAAARGANAIMFFQWRASRAGAEKFHSGMVPHAGTDSRVWREVTALGAELGRLGDLLASQVRAEVAILFDWESWWALELDSKPSSEIRLLPAIRTYYADLFRRNIAVDFAHPESDLSRYRLVLAPHLYLVNDRAVQNIESYVAGGGTLVMSFFCGIVDAHDHARLGGYPAPFQKMLGLRVEEFAPYAESQTNTICTQDEDEFESSLWSDVIRLQGAEAIAHYLGDYHSGSPAMTRNRFGNGTAFYLGTSPACGGLAWLLERALAAAGVKATGRSTAGVELVRRTNGTQSWLFALNHSAVQVDVPLDRPGQDLLTGAQVEGSLRLGPADVAIVQFASS